MSVSNFEELMNHIGHEIVCVGYRKERKPENPMLNVAVECETCNEVLLDFDKETSEDTEPRIVEAEHMKGFQEYMYKDGTRVPAGTPIGIEAFEDGEWKLKLLSGIFFSSEAWNDIEDEDEEDE